MNINALRVTSHMPVQPHTSQLDIDYTLFDLGSAAERPDELARPHLHEFLRDTYQFYDIIICGYPGPMTGVKCLCPCGVH
jgi:hypothetical protein